MDPGAAQEEKAHYKTADHDRRSGDLHRADRGRDPDLFRRKEPWIRDGVQCHRGIHIPGIRYQRKWNFLKGNDAK